MTTSVAGYRLLPHYPRLAPLFWLTGLAAATTWALILFQQPAIAFFYTLLPSMAIATSRRAGTFWIGSLIVGLTWWLATSGYLPLRTEEQIKPESAKAVIPV